MKCPLFLLATIVLASCNGVVKEYNKVMNDYGEDEHPIPVQYSEYSGDSLRNIAFPIGGISTGNILMGGRGNILEIEIFGKADLNEVPPYMTFFSIWGQDKAGNSFARVMEGQLDDNFPNPYGVPRNQLGGIPRFGDCKFTGGFPYAGVELNDADLPLRAELSAWNPFIPLDTDNSSLPVAVFDWTVHNKNSTELETVLTFNLGNPFTDRPGSRDVKGKVETIVKDGYSAVIFRQTEPRPAEVMVIASHPNVIVNNQWYRGGWWDNAQVFWKEFRKDGARSLIATESYEFSSRNNDVVSLGIPLTLAGGDSAQVSFSLFWRIPEQQAEASMTLGSGQKPESYYKNYYAAPYNSVTEIADHFFENEEMLRTQTINFNHLLFASSFPAYVKDAVASNLAGLNSNLIMRDEKGKVHAFEGLGNNHGCCPGNCTHVWNYAQSLAFLFPDLERDMRETNYLNDTQPNGYQSFRTVFPQGDYWFRNYAADGQMGTILRTYREWKFSGDTEWLRTIWPKLKLALEFAWKGAGEVKPGYSWTSNAHTPWDPGKTGVISGDQHNTYDINFFGPNMLTGSLYLGALRAASEMAEALGDTEKAGEYATIYNSGREKYEELLWNGEYYSQKVQVDPGIELPGRYKMEEDGKIAPKYQYGSGCLSDQLFGQFLADVSGLGYLLDSARTRQALQSVFRYNFIRDFMDFENVQRIYAANHESGLVLCTWPLGNKPVVPFVYSDEVWTGVEYQVAAGLIYQGMTDEGLEIARAVRERYSGYNRNPFGEYESGRYYARSFSSYALLTSLSGFRYDGTMASLSFAPAVNKTDFFTFWSAGSAWGSFEIRNKAIRLKVYHGKLELKDFSFSHPEMTMVQEASAGDYTVSVTNDKCKLQFPKGLRLGEGEEVLIGLE